MSLKVTKFIKNVPINKFVTCSCLDTRIPKNITKNITKKKKRKSFLNKKKSGSKCFQCSLYRSLYSAICASPQIKRVKYDRIPGGNKLAICNRKTSQEFVHPLISLSIRQYLFQSIKRLRI